MLELKMLLNSSPKRGDQDVDLHREEKMLYGSRHISGRDDLQRKSRQIQLSVELVLLLS